MKDFKMCHKDLVFKKRNKEILVDAGNNKYSFGLERADELKEWLDRVTQPPRYEIEKVHPITWIIWDMIDGCSVAAFHKRDGFDAESEAQKLCDKLNQENEGCE